MSRHPSAIDAGQTVDEVMRRWPATMRVFLDSRMACAECPIAGFHTVADACREYELEPAGAQFRAPVHHSKV
jgi:hybrid cluster-associated redox disulfide protein